MNDMQDNITVDDLSTNVETLKHIRRVQSLLMRMVCELEIRAINHDASKLASPEVSIFTVYTPKLKNSVYMSDEYKEFLKEMQVALKHHYACNAHHPEHYVNGVDDMSLIDVMEMLCDWKAASERHDTGDILQSIENNKDRFKIGNQLTCILRNTVPFLI